VAATNGRGGGAAPPPGGGGSSRSSNVRIWWWLPVLAIAVVVAVILVRGAGGEEEGGPAAVPETPSLEPVEPGAAGAGSITFGAEPAEPLLERGDLSGRVGEEVVGTLVPVDSVIAQGVLWVGEGRAQLLVVEPEDEETPVAPGDRVTFRGRLAELDDETRNAVWGAEAEPRIEAQGVYAEVDQLAIDGAP
jgi:hypothetical protein